MEGEATSRRRAGETGDCKREEKRAGDGPTVMSWSVVSRGPPVERPAGAGRFPAAAGRSGPGGGRGRLRRRGRGNR